MNYTGKEPARCRLGERIRARRKAIRLPQWQLAEKLELSQSMVSKLEKGHGDYSIDRLKKVALILECSVADLLQGVDDELEIENNVQVIRVPIVSWATAAGLFEKFDNALLGETLDFLHMTYSHGDVLALRVTSEQCNRVAPVGSEVIVDCQAKVLMPNRHFIIVLPDGRATMRVYQQDPDRFEPDSTESGFESYFPSSDEPPKVVGQVVRITKDLTK